MNLDCNSIDFAPATSEEEQGIIVVFETNAAAHTHFCQQAQKKPWDFVLPRGQLQPKH